MPDRLSTIRATLQSHGQEHLLTFWDELDSASQTALLTQLQGIDFDQVAELIQTHVVRKPDPMSLHEIEPAPYYAHEPGSTYDADHYREVGGRAARNARFAAR